MFSFIMVAALPLFSAPTITPSAVAAAPSSGRGADGGGGGGGDKRKRNKKDAYVLDNGCTAGSGAGAGAGAGADADGNKTPANADCSGVTAAVRTVACMMAWALILVQVVVPGQCCSTGVATHGSLHGGSQFFFSY